jgi:hypothetical protein
MPNSEVRQLPLDLLAFGARKLRADQRPVHRTIFDDRERVGFVVDRRVSVRRQRGLWLEEFFGILFIIHWETRVDDVVVIRVHRDGTGGGRHLVSGADERGWSPCGVAVLCLPCRMRRRTLCSVFV